MFNAYEYPEGCVRTYVESTKRAKYKDKPGLKTVRRIYLLTHSAAVPTWTVHTHKEGTTARTTRSAATVRALIVAGQGHTMLSIFSKMLHVSLGFPWGFFAQPVGKHLVSYSSSGCGRGSTAREGSRRTTLGLWALGRLRLTVGHDQEDCWGDGTVCVVLLRTRTAGNWCIITSVFFQVVFKK